LAQFRLYWPTRALVRRAVFWIEAQFFGKMQSVQENRSKFQSFRGLLEVAQFQFFLALLFAVILQYIDPYLYQYYNYINLSLPDDSESYTTFLATISGIGGVFIGLYYAAIATVGSAIYAEVPNNIRDLLAQERFGNVYMRFLSFITFLGLVLIAFNALGYPRVSLAVLFMVFAVGVGVIAFVNLGQRAFNLFDPTALSGHIFSQLVHWIKRVKAGGYLWRDDSFQMHAHKLASLHFDTLETLADISSKAPHLNGRPYVELCESVLHFLIVYELDKKAIPLDSLWYEQKYVHKEWYRTDDSTISMAHQTASRLTPDTSKNNLWVEDRLLPIIFDCIVINLKQRRFQLVLELLHHIQLYLERLAENHQLSRAYSDLEKIGDVIFQNAFSKEEKYVLEGEILERLAIVEHLSSFPIVIMLAYRKSVESVNKKTFYNKISNIKWREDSDIYQQGFPLHCLRQLEWLKPRLDFETQVEGNTITPLWYQSEIVLQDEAKQLSDNVQLMIDGATELYKQWIKISDDAKHPWISAAIISREWEYWNKADRHLQRFEQYWDEVNSELKIEGLDWPKISFQELIEKTEARNSELLKHMASESILLTLTERPEEFPDYGGQFLHGAGEALLEALCAGDLSRVKALFKQYFLGCAMQFDKLRPKEDVQAWKAQMDMKVASAPLFDLMELSGYARLFSDYHANPLLWEEVSNEWEAFFNEKGDGEREKMLAAIISVAESGFGIAHRGILRTGWQRIVEQKLHDVPRKERYSQGRVIGSYTTVIHESALVRKYADESMGSFYDGIDIFITYCLRTRPCGDELDLGRRRRDLRKDLARDQKKYEQHIKADEAELDE